MRRLLAITSVLTVLLSMASPVWATRCAAMGKTSMCHRNVAQHQHHCDDMTMQQDESPATNSETAFKGVSEKCPMQCCMQSQAGSGTAVLLVPFVFQLAVSDYHTNPSGVIFASVGFSSHTDRGPPLS